MRGVSTKRQLGLSKNLGWTDTWTANTVHKTLQPIYIGLQRTTNNPARPDRVDITSYRKFRLPQDGQAAGERLGRGCLITLAVVELRDWIRSVCTLGCDLSEWNASQLDQRAFHRFGALH